MEKIEHINVIKFLTKHGKSFETILEEKKKYGSHVA